MSLTEAERGRYARQLVLDEIGEEGQEKLKNARVLIVGAGGLGSPAAMYLAAAGVGHIGIADGDQVELSNLQRQLLHATADLGRPKAVSARETLTGLNPHVEVRAIEAFLTEANIGAVIAEYDLILDCTDSAAAKFLLNDACAAAGKPLIYAGIGPFRGQLMLILPGQTPCLRCVFGGPPERERTERERGVIGAVAGVIGSLQALEAVMYITGAGERRAGRLILFDGLSMSFRTVEPPRREDCPVCGRKLRKG